MSDIFMIPARYCERCGRLITSEKAIEDGMGPTCKCKAMAEEESKKPIKGQMSIFDYEKGNANES